LRNQASAFGQYSETRSRGYAGLYVRSSWATLLRPTTAQVAAVGVGLRRGLGRQPSAANARRISLRSAQCERATMHRVPRLAAAFGGLQQARSNGLPIAVAVRGPPSEARASPRLRSRANQGVAFCVDRVLKSYSCRAVWVVHANRDRLLERTIPLMSLRDSMKPRPRTSKTWLPMGR
jgi:hypothetical protein